MNKIALALFALFALCASAFAQVIPPGTNPVPGGCAFNSSPPSIPTGQAAWLQCDSTGNLKVNAVVTPGTASFTSSSTLAANQIIKASAGNIVSFNVSADSTLSGAAWWIMIYNATSAPADGAITPAKCYAMSSGTTSFQSAFTLPVAFSTGITIGVSTTGCFTKTASTHAFISGDFQ